jgi:hypothetical protein
MPRVILFTESFHSLKTDAMRAMIDFICTHGFLLFCQAAIETGISVDGCPFGAGHSAEIIITMGSPAEKCW